MSGITSGLEDCFLKISYSILKRRERRGGGLYVRGQHVQGSPFTLVVKNEFHEHQGVFHCCTFCSSGGQKAARCACGGTLPGGYQGCGHGHQGHPGSPHWSCCGQVKENSECVGVPPNTTSQRSLLRTVVL
ncbi:E3 ubiquitin-protein ligase TRIM45 [Podargus strigoides]